MKNLILLLIVCSMGIGACENADYDHKQDLNPIKFDSSEMEDHIARQKSPVLTGKIISEDAMPKAGQYSLVQLRNNSQQDFEYEINQDGTFALELPYDLPYQQIWFTVGEHFLGELILHDSLHIILDLQQIAQDTVRMGMTGKTFSGPDADIAIMLRSYQDAAYGELEGEDKMNRFYEAYWDTEIKDVDKIKLVQEYHQWQQSNVDDFIEDSSYPRSWLLQHKILDQYQELMIGLHFDKKMEAEYFSDAATYTISSVNNESVSTSRYLDMYLRSQYGEQYIQKLDSLGISVYKQDMLKLVSDYGDPEDKLEYYQETIHSIQTPWIKSLMQTYIAEETAVVNKIREKLKNTRFTQSSLIYADSLMSINEKTHLYKTSITNAADLIQNLHKQHPESVIILDNWTTWCGPCLSDMEYSKEIKKELLEHEGFKIIYLCHENGNSVENRWKKKIAEADIQGDHIFLHKELSRSVMQTYELRGFPSYYVIDRAGHLNKDMIDFMQYLKVDDFVSQF